MPLSLAPAHLKRYVEVARLFIKYGRGPLVTDLGRDLPAPDPDEKADSMEDRDFRRPAAEVTILLRRLQAMRLGLPLSR